MATADAFDEPIARPLRPARVITDAVESGPTILRDPMRRNGSLTDDDLPSANGFNGLSDTAVVERVAPSPIVPPDGGWPVPPPVTPEPSNGSTEAPSPTVLRAPVSPLLPAAPAVVPSGVPDGQPGDPDDGNLDGIDDWSSDGVDDGVAADAGVEEDAIEVPVRRSRRPRVRKVNRVVRRIDPWTVFKIALVLFVLLYAVLVVAGVILWDLANKTGTVDNIQGAVKELFALQTFVIDGKKLFRASWALGVVMAIGGTGFAVTLAVLFNLIADLVGGVRITVLEEEYVARESRSSRRAAKG
jgi:hypothetical protein